MMTGLAVRMLLLAGALGASAAGCGTADDAGPPADAAPPDAAGRGAPDDAAFGAADFARLGWLEGDWRGALPDGDAFYERYHLVDDSTLMMMSYADSAFANLTGSYSMALRGGRIEHYYGDMYWVAGELAADGSTIRFEPVRNAEHAFTWRRDSTDAWTATMHMPDGDEAYRMERLAPR